MNKVLKLSQKSPIDMDAYSAAFRAIENKVEAACKAAGHKKVYVIYSAYESDDNDNPIDNLNEIAIHGKVKFAAVRDEFYGGAKSKNYESEIIENPTWLQIAVMANAMIRKTRDRHHCFLEGHDLIRPEGDVLFYEFVMGS